MSKVCANHKIHSTNNPISELFFHNFGGKKVKKMKTGVTETLNEKAFFAIINQVATLSLRTYGISDFIWDSKQLLGNFGIIE